MRKLKAGLLVLVSALLLTACSCSKTVNEYTVDFDSNGGTRVKSQTVEEGSRAKRPEDPTKTGYTFEGWYLDLDDDEEFDFNTKIKEDITLEAKWSGIGESESDSFTVTLDDKNGNIKTISIISGETLEMPETPTRYGYKFVEWRLNGKPYDFNTPVTGDITLEAVWEELSTYTVTFDSNGGTNVNAKTVYEGYKVVAPSAPTRDGKIFTGWYLNGKIYDFNTPVYNNINLVAGWRDPYTYTVSFYGECVDSTCQLLTTFEVIENSTLNDYQNAIPDFEEEYGTEDYEFYYWYNKNAVAEKDTYIDFYYENGITSNLEFYAYYSGKPLVLESATPAEIPDDFTDTTTDVEAVKNNQGKFETTIETDEDDNKYIEVRETSRLENYTNKSGESAKWYGLLVDLGVPASEIISDTDYVINDEDRTDLGKFGAESANELMLWLKGDTKESTKEYKFHTNKGREITLTVKYIPAEMQINSVTAAVPKAIKPETEPHKAEIEFNQSAFTVEKTYEDEAKTVVNVNVNETSLMKSWEANGQTAKWFGLMVDLNIPISDITTDESIYKIEDVDRTYSLLSWENNGEQLIIWLSDNDAEQGFTITFTDKVTGKEVTVSVKFNGLTKAELPEVTTDTFAGDEHAQAIADNQKAVEITSPLTRDYKTENYTIGLSLNEKAMTNWESGKSTSEDGHWFALMLDLGIACGKLDQTSGKTNYELTEADFAKAKELGGSDTAFIVWLTTEYFESGDLVLRFTDKDTGKEIKVTIKATVTKNISLSSVPTSEPITEVPTTNETEVTVPSTSKSGETKEDTERTEIVIDAEETKIPDEITVEE